MQRSDSGRCSGPSNCCVFRAVIAAARSETGLCERHSAAAGLDDHGRPVLTLHSRQLLQVVNLDIGICDRGNARANGRDEGLRLLRAGDQSSDTVGPLEQRQKLRRPHTLEIRMTGPRFAARYRAGRAVQGPV